MYTTVELIKNAGFSGFYPIAQLWDNHNVIPVTKGIYVIVQPAGTVPIFLEKGSGGFFKQRDPNAPVTELAGRWIPDCKIIYVGKAGGSSSQATLRSRLKQYLDFGKGKPVGHWGGRLIWQLKHHPELMVAWKSLPNGDPREEERRLNESIREYYGKLPFANLKE